MYSHPAGILTLRDLEAFSESAGVVRDDAVPGSHFGDVTGPDAFVTVSVSSGLVPPDQVRDLKDRMVDQSVHPVHAFKGQ